MKNNNSQEWKHPGNRQELLRCQDFLDKLTRYVRTGAPVGE